MNNKDLVDIETTESLVASPLPKPSWLKVKLPTGQSYHRVKALIDEHDLHTVCESAACPNRGECWSASTATFMILGNICTRSCGFCNVITGKPTELDLDEPRRVAEAVRRLSLKYAVITSVNRDELKDGGAGVWAETIKSIRSLSPACEIEVLIPDFCGNWENLATVLKASPDVLNHNIETVPRLYLPVRPQGNYRRSLELLLRAKEFWSGSQPWSSGAPANGLLKAEESECSAQLTAARSGPVTTKSGLMVGLGETEAEVISVLRDLKAAQVDLVTIGQYMQPTARHLPVAAFIEPAQFDRYYEIGMELGFANVFSGPLVRSSYHAGEQTKKARS